MSGKTSALLALLIGCALLAFVLRSALGGPPTSPREADIAGAQKEVAPRTGRDERVELAAVSGVAGNGIVEPADRETKVAGQVPGRIARVLVKEGDKVEVDAPLLALEAATEAASLAAAEADLGASEADLTRTLRGLRRQDIDAVEADAEAAKARSELSRGALDRISKLAEGGAATPDELDRAKRNAEAEDMAFKAADARRSAALAGSRREDVMAARARVLAAQARRDQARALLDRLTIRAPIAGEVLSIKFRSGEYYNPGAGEAVVLGDTRVLRVRMDVEERDIGKIRKGLRAHVTADAFPGERFPGRVVEIGRRMGRKNIRTDDPVERIDTKILEVVIELDRRDGLIPGLRVVSVIDDKSLN
jgi:HlyD family secretion protein